MKPDIAICIQGGTGLDAAFEPRFGRAPSFLLTDEAGSEVEIVPNHGATASHGAGTGAAAFVGGLGVRRVVAGRFGPKAHRALAALGVEMWLAQEGQSAGEVLASLRAGALERQR